MRKHFHPKFIRKQSFTACSYLLQLVICLIPAIISLFIVIILRRSSANAVDRIYSSCIFPRISSFVGSAAKLTRHSLTSIIYILAVIAAAVFIVSFVVYMIKAPDKLFIAGAYLKIAVFTVSFILFLFSILCMPNYY